jgi:probable H4MPT-linked C1 transfer pathway protein
MSTQAIESRAVTGWDIGGAHVKVARSQQAGQLDNVLQLNCPLWKGIDQLQAAINDIKQRWDNRSDYHLITMTGELADCFAHRQQGVEQIVDVMLEIFGEQHCQFFASPGQLVNAEQAKTAWSSVASMNWLASTHFASNYIENGLFIDIGSTTTDIIPIIEQQACPQGWTDFQRQTTGELCYSGAIRTPLMALASSAPFAGQWTSLASEWFAQSGDCWSLLGHLDPSNIIDPTADGQSWQATHCAARLARMLGTDRDQADSSAWHQLAAWFAEKQLQRIIESCQQVISAHPELTATAPIIGAGVGRFIAKLVATRLARPYIDLGDIDGMSRDGADHAPAAALALLAPQQLT